MVRKSKNLNCSSGKSFLEMKDYRVLSAIILGTKAKANGLILGYFSKVIALLIPER